MAFYRSVLTGILIISAFFLRAQVDSVYYGQGSDSARKEERVKAVPKWRNNLQWGGNFQAWIGNPTFILLSPTVGYRIKKDLSAGIGLIYNYTSYNTIYGKYSQSILGGHSYARHIIAQNYFVQLQYDKLRQPDLLSYDPSAKVWVDYVLAGGGFRHAIGSKAVFMTSILYNLTPHVLSIYPSRLIVQFGIVGGF